MKLFLVVILVLAATVPQCIFGAGHTTIGANAADRYEDIPKMCLAPMDFGYCRAKVKRYYFDTRRMKCNVFYWGGCAGNTNNFKSIEECNKQCLDSYVDDSVGGN